MTYTKFLEAKFSHSTVLQVCSTVTWHQITSDNQPHQRTGDRQLYAVYLLQRYPEFQYVVLLKAMFVLCLYCHHTSHAETKLLCDKVLRDVISLGTLFLCGTLYPCTLHLCTIKCKAINICHQQNEWGITWRDNDSCMRTQWTHFPIAPSVTQCERWCWSLLRHMQALALLAYPQLLRNWASPLRPKKLAHSLVIIGSLQCSSS